MFSVAKTRRPGPLLRPCYLPVFSLLFCCSERRDRRRNTCRINRLRDLGPPSDAKIANNRMREWPRTGENFPVESRKSLLCGESGPMSVCSPHLQRFDPGQLAAFEPFEKSPTSGRDIADLVGAAGLGEPRPGVPAAR